MNGLYELWFRAAFKSALQKREATMAIRPGDRRHPNPKGAREGEYARVRIMTKPGDEARGIQPEFDAFETLVRISKIVVKRLGQLEESELAGCLPNCRGKEAARHELGLIYNREFNDDDIVSILYFDYVKRLPKSKRGAKNGQNKARTVGQWTD